MCWDAILHRICRSSDPRFFTPQASLLWGPSIMTACGAEPKWETRWSAIYRNSERICLVCNTLDGRAPCMLPSTKKSAKSEEKNYILYVLFFQSVKPSLYLETVYFTINHHWPWSHHYENDALWSLVSTFTGHVFGGTLPSGKKMVKQILFYFYYLPISLTLNP